MNPEHFLKKNYMEVARDFSAFGDPVILILMVILIVGFDKIVFRFIFGLTVIEIICRTMKYVFYKQRPNNEKYRNFLEKTDSGAFPSIHSARSIFVFSGLCTILYSTYFVILCVLIIFGVGISRIILKKHYLSDVIGGYLTGILVFLLWRIL